MSKSHFHQGELAIQEKYNIQHDPRLAESMLKEHIVPRFVPFIEQQSTIIVGTADKNGQLWTSMLFGDVGFVKVQNPQKIILNLRHLKSTDTDILFQNIVSHSSVGILFIDTATRSRFRLNGYASIFADRIEITVSEAYPNCPKYIQQRIPTLLQNNSELRIESTRGTKLTSIHIEWIKNADTFFLSSRNLVGDMDASHRGGGIGFIDILDNGTLKIPDYVGNNLFNSLGNFVQVPRAGLLFMDFNRGHALQLTGETSLLFDQNTSEDQGKTTGTGRYWLFKTQSWHQTKFHNNIDWKLISFSPFNPKF